MPFSLCYRILWIIPPFDQAMDRHGVHGRRLSSGLGEWASTIYLASIFDASKARWPSMVEIASRVSLQLVLALEEITFCLCIFTHSILGVCSSFTFSSIFNIWSLSFIFAAAGNRSSTWWNVNSLHFKGSLALLGVSPWRGKNSSRHQRYQHKSNDEYIYFTSWKDRLEFVLCSHETLSVI